MAKPKITTDANIGVNRQAMVADRANPLIGPQMPQFWELQEKLLSEAEEFSKNWFARRHEAALSALRASEEAIGNAASDPACVMKAMINWQAHSAERISEDILEWIDLWSRCARSVASSEAKATKEVLENAAETAAAAKAGHATPV